MKGIQFRFLNEFYCLIVQKTQNQLSEIVFFFLLRLAIILVTITSCIYFSNFFSTFANNGKNIPIWFYAWNQCTENVNYRCWRIVKM